LRWKLLLTYLLISIIPMLVLWATMVTVLEDHVLEQRAGELRALATGRASVLGAEYVNYPILRHLQDQVMRELAESQQVWIVVVDSYAAVIFDSLSADADGEIRATASITEALGGTHHSTISEDRAIAIEIAPIVDDDGNVVGAVMMSQPFVGLDELVSAVNSGTVQFTLLIGLIVVIVVIFIAQWFMRPMRRILLSAQRISNGHLEERVAIKGNDEFAELGLAINDMTHKLAQVETVRQEFVSNVSHELKTPLSGIKVLSESLIHQGGLENEMHLEFLTDITMEVDRMTDIVNDLLMLVRMDESEMPLKTSQFSLNKTLEDVIKRLNPLAHSSDIKIEFSELKQVNVEADEMKISLAISNLVENAIKYNNPGGTAAITLDSDNKSAFVTVADNGVGISEENQAKVFTRFFRVDKGRDRETGGTGLGLAITHKTILLHKGSIKLTSKEDEGSTFVVRIPLITRSS